MRPKWILFLAAVDTVGGFVNNSPGVLESQAVSAPQPATGGGWDNEDEVWFPVTLLDDQKWYDYKYKGRNLVKAMHSNNFDAAKLYCPIRPTAESPWDDYGALASWGWTESSDPEDLFVNFLMDDQEHNGESQEGWGLDVPLEESGLNTHSGDDLDKNIKIIHLNHFQPGFGPLDGQTYHVGPKIYRATGAHYRFGIETSTGAMFSLLLRSPERAGESRIPVIDGEGLPELQRASDIMWLCWAKYAEPKNRLKYFFNVGISNPETQQTIRRVLKTTNTAYSPWPGATFSTATAEGRALLGTPNGRGHGYFLTQHKAALGGNMYISKIQVFHGTTEPYTPMMVLHVEQPKPQSEGATKKRAQRKTMAKL